MAHLGVAPQQLLDSQQDAPPLQRVALVALAGQLLHAGREEQAAHVLPYLLAMSTGSGWARRAWVAQLLPRDWCRVRQGDRTERPDWLLGTESRASKAALLGVMAEQTAALAHGRSLSLQQQDDQVDGVDVPLLEEDESIEEASSDVDM